MKNPNRSYHVEPQQNLRDDLRDTVKVLCKLGLIINQYVHHKIDLPTSGGRYKYLILTRHVKQFKRNGLFSYANQTLLQTNTVEYKKFSITFDQSVPYEITKKNEKLFMGYVEGSICGLRYTTLKRKCQTTFRESPKQNF